MSRGRIRAHGMMWRTMAQRTPWNDTEMMVVAMARGTIPPPKITITTLATLMATAMEAFDIDSRSKRWWPIRAPPKVSPGMETARPTARMATQMMTWSWKTAETWTTFGKKKAIAMPARGR